MRTITIFFSLMISLFLFNEAASAESTNEAHTRSVAASTNEPTSQNQAEEHAETGWNYLTFGMYTEAEAEFKKALDLNPENDNYRLGYARSLIKNQKSSSAIEVLEKTSDSAEKRLLTGVAYFNENQFENANKQLMTLTSDESFSRVASNYLAAIDRRKKHIKLTASTGVMYDTRIIQEDILEVDNLDGPRAYISGQADYRLLNSSKNTLSVLGEVQTLYTFNDDLSLSDPLRVAIGLPWLNKASKIGENESYLAPTIEHILIDLNGDGKKTDFSSGFLLDWILTKQTSESSARTWKIALRYDKGHSQSLEGASDIDGPSFSFKYDKFWFFNNLNSHGLNFGLLFGGNVASGQNIKYVRAGSNLSYFFPFFYKVNAAALFDVRYTNYIVHAQGRADLEFTYGVRFARPFNDWLTVNLSLANNDTNSTLENRDNSRFVGSLVANGKWSY